MKPITGQYECTHQSGIGLDYFTSRLDRLTVYPNGRFLLITQDRSRISNAAQSLLSGQQVSTAAPESRREGNYILQGNAISFRFEDGSQEQGQVSWNGEGIQIGQNFYNKVSDSTMIPPTQRMKKDMDDIAKGLKIAGTIGGMAIKAAKPCIVPFKLCRMLAASQILSPPRGKDQTREDRHLNPASRVNSSHSKHRCLIRHLPARRDNRWGHLRMFRLHRRSHQHNRQLHRGFHLFPRLPGKCHPLAHRFSRGNQYNNDLSPRRLRPRRPPLRHVVRRRVSVTSVVRPRVPGNASATSAAQNFHNNEIL